MRDSKSLNCRCAKHIRWTNKKWSVVKRGCKGPCEGCKKEFTASRSHQRFCSISCHNLHRKPTEFSTISAQKARRDQGLEKFKTNPTLKLGKRGYWLIYIPVLHPALKQGWMKYHHYIWWQHNKELPPKGMHIHHINGDKLDNNIKNLRLITPSEHSKLHSERRRN